MSVTQPRGGGTVGRVPSIRVRSWLTMAAFAGVLLAACSGGGPADGGSQGDAARIGSGQQVWSLNCAVCHGTEGQGVSAPALNSQQFFRATTDEQIADIVRKGVPGTVMAPWWTQQGGPLTEQQIQDVVAYIRSWETSAPSCPDWRTPSCPGEVGG